MSIRRRRRFVIALILPTFLFYLWKTRAKTLLLDDADDNSHLCLYVGDTISIKLVSNPTTGYEWAKPEELAHLQLLSSGVGQFKLAGRTWVPGAIVQSNRNGQRNIHVELPATLRKEQAAGEDVSSVADDYRTADE